MTKISIQLAGGDPPFTDICEVLSTWDIHGMSRPTLNEKEKGISVIKSVLGLPDVYRIHPKTFFFQDNKRKPDFVKMDSDHTFYLLKINAEIQTNKTFPTRESFFAWWNFQSENIKRYYSDQLTSACTHYRSHNNGFGLDNMRNYLTGERMGSDYPRFFHIVTSRIKVKAVIQAGEPLKRNIAGPGLCLAFECINASDPEYWKFSPLLQPYLFDRSPISTARDIGTHPSGGNYIIRDDKHEFYPQFSQRLVFPLWLPYDNIAFIPVSQVRRLRRNETQNGKRLDNIRMRSNL